MQNIVSNVIVACEVGNFVLVDKLLDCSVDLALAGGEAVVAELDRVVFLQVEEDHSFARRQVH